MAHKRKKQTNTGYALTAVVLVMGYIFLDLMRDKDFRGIIFVFGFTALVGLVLFVVVPMSRRHALLERIDTITDSKIDALVRQRTIMVRADPYGKPLLNKWRNEIEYFITHHVRPALMPSQIPRLEKHGRAISERIAQRVAAAAQQRPATPCIPASMTGAEFEVFCANQLQSCGWAVRVTPLCRDQGVDVIAEKNGLLVALQCKLYSSPVGNKAVQEIAAGRVYQQAHHGAVVTNGTYTASAEQLADTIYVPFVTTAP